MKHILVAITLLSISWSAFGDTSIDVPLTVQSELATIPTLSTREKVLATNRLINLGEEAVAPLSDALLDSKSDLTVKWTVALTLGEIGSQKALPALAKCQTSDNDWLKKICKNSTAIINGEVKRAGKVYLYSIGKQVTRTDVESGRSEIIP